jgi:uncharacterized protein
MVGKVFRLEERSVKIVIPGGSGQVGAVLTKDFQIAGHEVVILGRGVQATLHGARHVQWDAKTLSAWSKEIDGADAVINLAGRSVNCRYTPENRRLITDSRVESTRIVGEAIASAKNPPRAWLQASTATIYAHRFDAPNDDATGIIGGNEPNAPDTWVFSIGVAKAWEAALEAANTPNTRKVALRSAMVMDPFKDGIFDTLLKLVRYGLGGDMGSGNQYISWIHDSDFTRAIQFILERQDLTGAINISSPNPLSNHDFMRQLREAWGTRFGLNSTNWMLEIGTLLMQTETELVLKSRRVVPSRLLETGFEFKHPDWHKAAIDLVKRWRAIAAKP